MSATRAKETALCVKTGLGTGTSAILVKSGCQDHVTLREGKASVIIIFAAVRPVGKNPRFYDRRSKEIF